MFYFPLKPTRITLTSELFEKTSNDCNYICQKKKNGWRVQVHKNNDVIEIYTRHKIRIEPLILECDWKKVYERLNQSLNCSQCILDGEFLHRRSSIKEALYFWDIFELNNKVLKESYQTRKQQLGLILTPQDKLELSQDVETNFKDVWNCLEDEVDEGLVIKDLREPLYISYSKTIKSARQFKLLRNDIRNR